MLPPAPNGSPNAAASSSDLAAMMASMAAAGPVVDVYPGDALELHARLIRNFEEAETQSQDARWMAERCRDYKDGKQWTAEEVAILRKRGQPPTYNNVINRRVQLLMGLERRGRSDPKAFPRTPVEDMRADAATQALRYVADENRFDVVRSSAYENMLVEGFGGCEVIVEQDGTGTGYDVVINHIPWDRLFYDPHSRHPGFSDARYLGVVIWMDRDEALEQYPGCDNILSDTFASVSLSNTFEDKPTFSWCDNNRRRVRVVQIHWKIARDWWTATITRGGFLEQPQKSPYLDRHGYATCPIILRSIYCDRDNNRFGIVKDWIPLQDSINKRESKLLHALSVNRIVATQGSVENVDKARREAAKPDGYIEIVPIEGGRFEIQKDTAEIQGHFQMLQYSVGQMNVAGPNASMAGKDPRDQSGRAIIAQQAGGQVENEPIADTLRQWTHKVYEAAWMRVKQFWTDERWIRVTDNERNIQFVGLNRRITLQNAIEQLGSIQLIQQKMAELGLKPGDPRLQNVIKVENDVSDMDVDITVEEGPDVPTIQAEQFQTLMSMPPNILQQFPPELIIQASSLRNKDQLIELLHQHQQQAAASQQQQQAAASAMQQAQTAKVNADAADKQAQAVERLHGIQMDHSAAQAQAQQNALTTLPPSQSPQDQAGTF